MDFNSHFYDDLPENPEEAFVVFESLKRSVLARAHQADCDQNYIKTGDSEYYAGNYRPERDYLSAIMAFIDEYEIDISIENLSYYDDNTFFREFQIVLDKINHTVERYKLRRKRGLISSATPAFIAYSSKDEIHNLLNKIRKIVNQEIVDESHKESLFKKINDLAQEVDKDRTTFDAIMSRCVDFSKAMGEIAENLEPVADLLERILRLITAGCEKIKLPKRQEPQALPAPDQVSSKCYDEEEIPF
jgi:hypothetical protein